MRSLFAEVSKLQCETVQLGDYRGSERFTIDEREPEMMVHSINFEGNLGGMPFSSSRTNIMSNAKQEFLNIFPILQHPFNLKNQRRDSRAPFCSLKVTFLFLYYNSGLPQFLLRFPHFTVETACMGRDTPGALVSAPGV